MTFSFAAEVGGDLRNLIEVTPVLQTYGPSQTYESNGLAVGEDDGQSLDFGHYIGILRRRIFYFIIPFCILATAGLYFVTTVKPMYRSEGKILVEQGIAPDLLRPVVTATANERIQLIQQRIMTRDNLRSIADKFGLFPGQPESGTIFDLMQERIQIKLVDTKVSTIAFTVSFDHERPELAMGVANDLLTLILNEDARTRTGRATETVRILESEVKGLQDKLEATQAQISDVKRRPRDSVADVPDQEKSQLDALAALKAELIQKTSVYSDAHPAVVALKKRIAAMEKSLTQPVQVPAPVQATQADDLETLQRQRQAVEKRLDDATSKLATARLGETLEKGQQSDRFQVIEQPTLPHRPLKSGRLKLVGIAFGLAAMVGVGAILAAEMFDRSISGGHELSSIVDSHLIVSIPYISTRSEILRMKRRGFILGAGILVVMLLGGLAAAVVYGLIDFSWIDRPWLDALMRLSR